MTLKFPDVREVDVVTRDDGKFDVLVKRKGKRGRVAKRKIEKVVNCIALQPDSDIFTLAPSISTHPPVHRYFYSDGKAELKFKSFLCFEVQPAEFERKYACLEVA